MGEEYPYTGCDGQHPWALKRPWEVVDHSESGPTGQWQDKQHQGKRLCLPGSFEYNNIQMQMRSTIPLQPSNEVSEPLGFVESSLSPPGLHETPGLLWRNDGSGASPLYLR